MRFRIVTNWALFFLRRAIRNTAAFCVTNPSGALDLDAVEAQYQKYLREWETISFEAEDLRIQRPVIDRKRGPRKSF